MAHDPSMIALAIALAIDATLGEPPDALHPVVWMGSAIKTAERAALRRSRPSGQLVAGALIALAIPALFVGASILAVRTLPAWLEVVAVALLLKPMFAARALGRAARAVEDSLRGGKLDRARADLRSLCSRDPSQLDAPLLIAGTVESLAENASDSVVAPLFYYALFGLPGAVAYRAVNTLDAMIGYHGRHEYVGKAAARLDDALNLIPARITALLLIAAGGACGADVRGGWRVLRRDGGATESPNAGRPMAAMAGLLGVALDKPGHYRLGDPARALTADTIAHARRITAGAMALAAALALLAIGARRASLA